MHFGRSQIPLPPNDQLQLPLWRINILAAVELTCTIRLLSRLEFVQTSILVAKLIDP